MIPYNIKLVSNFNQMEFTVNTINYEEYLDRLSDEEYPMSYEQFLEYTISYAYNILTNVVGAPATNGHPVSVKKVIPEDQKPSEKQIKWAQNLGIENIDQYTKKELGELIKKMLAEQ